MTHLPCEPSNSKIPITLSEKIEVLNTYCNSNIINSHIKFIKFNFNQRNHKQ